MIKKTAIFALFITIMYFIPSAAAETVKSLSITDTLQLDKALNETVYITISNNNQTDFSFSLPENSEDIIVNGVFFGSNNTLSIPLSCTTCNISIAYTLNGVSRGNGGLLEFSRTLNFPGNPQSLNYKVILPPGYRVEKSENTSLETNIAPTPTSIYTDGNNIIIYWEQRFPKLPQIFFVRYSQAVDTDSDSVLLLASELIAAFILGGALGIFLSFRYHKRKQNANHPSSEHLGADFKIPSSLLSPDEKKIIGVLEKNNKVMNQKEIGKVLEWSRSKVSSIMTNLEYKKIVEREKFGRNYKVKLVRKFSD